MPQSAFRGQGRLAPLKSKRWRSAGLPTNTTPRRNGARLESGRTIKLILKRKKLDRPRLEFPRRKFAKPARSATRKSAIPASFGALSMRQIALSPRSAHVIVEATAKTGGQMTEPTEKNELLVYENVDTAPFVYFDISPAHGIIGGAIQIELAARILNAVSDGSVEIKFITSGRLRCSPAAAMNLRNAIDAALKMLEQPQQAPAATARLN